MCISIKQIVTTIILLLTFELSAAILEPTSNELYLKTAWEQILDKTLDRYLKRYEKGALSGVEITAREQALKTIHSTMNSAMSWNTVGEEVMMVIAVECGEKLLDQLTALKFDGTDNPQVATPLFKKYIVCANSGIKKSIPILLKRIKAVGPKIHKIVRQYNPDF